MDVEAVRALCLRLPGVEEAPSYGTPGFRVRKKLLARIHQSEPAIVLRVQDLDQQEALIAAHPKVFYLTDHYAGHRFVLARLATVKPAQLQEVFEAAWRAAASKRQIAEYEA